MTQRFQTNSDESEKTSTVQCENWVSPAAIVALHLRFCERDGRVLRRLPFETMELQIDERVLLQEDQIASRQAGRQDGKWLADRVPWNERATPV